MQIHLKLLPTNQPQRDATAWLVPGTSCAAWLQELTAWEVDLTNVRLIRLPAGLLVVTATGSSPRCSPTTLAFGALAENVFMPVEASLNAAVSRSELQEIFSRGKTYIWHPSAGLMVAEAGDEMRIDDLLGELPRRQCDWSRAAPGVAFNGRMLSLEPLDPTPLAGLWRDVQDDIGSQTPTLDDLPRSPTEPSSHPLGKLGRGMKAGLAKAVKWLMQPGQGSLGVGRAGAAAGGMMGGWLGQWGSGLAQWANEQLAKLSAALEEERHREISRLLHMLDSDPDAGLRYAIPFSNDPGRGVAMPTSRLGERNVDFRLGGSGGAADAWNISPQYQIKLIARYRELANREIALGRHRRAAYIFAHLLGDFASAARTLADGGHYREAAVLYEEKLTNPLEAAKTLERGSLWSEAIAIYERLGHDEKVGDLYQQLDQLELAAAAYRREVTKSLRTDNVLAAARLLETKLAAPQEAINALLNAWPESAQAIRCVSELFQLLARRGEHKLAERQVRRYTQSTGGRVSLASKLAAAFGTLSSTYPDGTVRATAADQVRMLAAEYLPQAEGGELLELTGALRSSTPQDHLLRRDVQRFVQQRPQRQQPAARKPKIELLRQIRLGAGRWKTLLAAGEEFYAAGVQDGRYFVARGSWRGNVQITSHPAWQCQTDDSWPVLLAAHERFGPLVLQPVMGRPLTGEAIFPATSEHPRIVVGSHPGLAGWDARQFVMGMGYTNLGTFDVVKVHDLTGEVVWSSHALLAANLLGTWRLDSPTFQNSQWAHFEVLLFNSGQLYCGIGRQLCVFSHQGLQRSIELPGEIGRLTASRPWTRQRIVVSLADGGVVLWGDTLDAPQASFGQGLACPHTCLTRGGLLVAAADGVVEVYDTRDGKLSLLALKAEPSFQPRGLVATDHPEQFAMLMEDGTVLVQALEMRR